MDNSNKVPSEETIEENLQASPTLSSDTLSQSNSNEEASSTAGDTAPTASPELEKKKKKSRLSFKALKSAPKKLIPKRFKGEKAEDKTPTEGRSEAISIAIQGGDPAVEDDAVNPAELEFEPFANTEIREKVEEQQQEKTKKKKSSSIVKRFTFGKRSKVTPTADDIQAMNNAAKTTANSSTETELLSSTEIEDDVNLSVSEVSLVEEDVLESLPTTLPSPTTAKKQEKLLITITGKIDNSNEGGVNNKKRNALAAAVDNISKVSSSTANDIQLPVGINTTTTPSTTTANSTPAAAATAATAFNKGKKYDTAIISAGDYSKATTVSDSTLISPSATSASSSNNNNTVSDSSEIYSKNQKDKPLTISSLLLLDDKTGQTVEKSNSNEKIEENITKRNNKPISLTTTTTTTTTTTSQSIKLNSQEIVVSEPTEFVKKTLSDVTSPARAATIASTATATASQTQSQSQASSKRTTTTEKFTIVGVAKESNGRLVSAGAGAVPTTAIPANILETQNIELRISENFEYTDSQLKTIRAKEDFMQNNSGSGSGSSEKQTGEAGAIEERRGSSTVRVQDSRNPYQLGNSITNPNLPGFKSPDLVVAGKDNLSPNAGAAAGDDADAQSGIKFNIGTPVRPLKTSMVTHISEVISIEGAPSISESASIDINSPGASGASSYRRRIAYVPQNTVYTPEEEELLSSQAKSLSDEISEISFDSATSLEIKMSPPHGDLIAENVIASTMSASPENREHLYKILVIGELGTGKTSFIKRYVHQFFSQNYRATIGVDFALKVLNWDSKTIIRLQLWDIAGQERFGNMTRVYYKEAVGAFIVFDVTRSSTFEAVVKWKQDLDSKVQLPDGNPIPCILLANKCDQTKQGLAATPEKLDEYVAKHGFAGWYETSAKENINIEEAAKALVNKILSNDRLLNPGDTGDNDVFALDGKKDPKSGKCGC